MGRVRALFIVLMVIALAYLVWAAIDPAAAAKIFGS